MIAGEELDSHLAAECVGFLDTCFDNSFTLQSSLKLLKSIKDELDEENSYLQSHTPNTNEKTKGKSIQLHNESGSLHNTSVIASQECLRAVQSGQSDLRAWGLPEDIVNNYENRGIKNMFEWQVTCLGNSKVLLDYANLVYSAPTSAGKTLVAELLAIKTILERQKKVIMILPFVSVVREKMFYFQQIFSSAGIRVEGFMGSHAPPGGFQSVHIAICTIEKANSLVNRLLDEGNISELGAVVVDEMHLLGDSSRGYILELLLTKIKYVTKKLQNIHIQIIGMSATLPNLPLLSNWLDAELFVTDFRPIPLEEYCIIGNKVLDKGANVVRTIDSTKDLSGEGDSVMQICLETLKDGCSVLIFCTTKNWCENLSQKIASTFYKMGCSETPSGKLLRGQLNSECILEVLEQLKSCPVGLDAVLKTTVSFGVAYHHAGLTFDERDIIEGAFKSGALRILVATSTLSSGVNLPARRVIIRSPVFQKQPINILTYKQMIGRAGRMGKDVKGESILMCTEAERKVGLELMSGALDPVKSCIEGGDKYMRAILEVIASQVASTKSELKLYTECTLLFHQDSLEESHRSILDETLACLVNFELVRTQGNDGDTLYVATPLGKACLSSSMAPNDGLSLFCELQKARQCLVLETDLHLIYLVTPYSVSGQWPNIDWLHLLKLWTELPKAMKRVGELVGVEESFIFRCVRGTVKFNSAQTKVQIHKRFYTALALQDLVNEVPLSEVADRFRCCRGLLQSLQQSAATFAGMVTAFCHQLGWKNIEMLVSQFQDRLHFGIQSELLDLMRLPSLNGLRARSLFNAGLESVCLLATADVNTVENALHLAVPFQSEKGREGEDKTDAEKRNKVKNIWITGHSGMTAKQAAGTLIHEARSYLQLEIGVTEIKWKQDHDKECKLKESKNVKEESSVMDSSQVEQASMNDIFNCSHKSQHSKPNEIPLQNTPDDKILSDKYDVNLNEKKLTSRELPLSKEEIRKSLSQKEIKSSTSHCRNSDSIWSPFSQIDAVTAQASNIVTINKTKGIVSKLQNITPDTSMFSSDDPDSPNLFEESLPVNTQLCKLIDVNNTRRILNISRKRKMECDLISFNQANFLKDAFQSTFDVGKDESSLSVNSDEEDIKLRYDEDINLVSDSLETAITSISDEEIPSSQETDDVSSINTTHHFEVSTLLIKKNSSSRLDQLSTSSTPHTAEPIAKKIKLSEEEDKFWERLPKFQLKYVIIPTVTRPRRQIKMQNLKINIDNIKFTCIFLSCDEYLNFLNFLELKKNVAIFLHVDSKTGCDKPLIGSNIINKSIPTVITETNFNKFQIKNTTLKGLSLYFCADICFYIDFTIFNQYLNIIFEKINAWLSKSDVNLSLHSSKFNCAYLKQCGIELQSWSLDTSLMEWLIDSDTTETSIGHLITKYCQRDISLCREEQPLSNSNHSRLSDELLACVKAWGVWHVAGKQIKFLQEQYSNVRQVLGIETHISLILSESEASGLRVDKELASRLLVDVKSAQETLQVRAYTIYGRRFNFNSSKEVAKALGMYNGRKVSTKKSVLSAHNSPLARIITYWRKLNAILTRTLYPLTAKAVLQSENSRIHATYVTHTCTGRVSMHEPNLQNVPRNFSIPAAFLTPGTELNIENSEHIMEFSCRSIFLASPGWVIVSADYCQLEMRILTHLCGDKVLMAIMKSDMDVFKSIAASWGSVPEEKVDEELRQRAKQLCYGIIYGMGNKTLAQQLDVTELEAAIFMDSFHSTYAAIKVFTQKVISECRQKGYIETLKKRRRYFPMINSVKICEKNSAERQAVNTTIQGSAADIAKAAMCAVDEHVALCRETGNVRLLLQLHDELIYEVLDTKKEFFVDTLKNAMEQAVHLSVPLPVKIKMGHSWGSLKEFKV